MDVHLPDVSHYQGTVDWGAVISGGCHGGIVKATDGAGYTDPTFRRNWDDLGRRGAVRGAYHFGRADQDSGEAQADRFLGVLRDWKAGDLLILDLELGSGDLSGFALAWLGRVQERTGLLPWFYSYGPFIRAHIHDSRLARFPLWLAAYSNSPPPAPPPWAAWALWQHTDKARLPGIAAGADHSKGRINVTAAAPPAPAGHPHEEEDPMADPVKALAAPNGGIWVLTKRGGLFGFDNGLGGPPAPFYGSVQALLPQNQPPGPFFDLQPWGNGGYRIRGTLPDGTESHNDFDPGVFELIKTHQI